MNSVIVGLGAYPHPRAAPLLDTGTRPADPGRHARRSAMGVSPATVAFHAAPGGGARSAVAGHPNFSAAAPVTVKKGKGGRSRVVPAHPELVTSSSRYPGAGPTTVYSTFLHGPRPGGSRRPCHGLLWRDLMFAAR